jgi:ATP-dependent RNA helicase DHX34
MSATINPKLFGDYFNAPIITVPGRLYPVKIRYFPITSEDDDNLLRASKENKDSIPVRSNAKFSCGMYFFLFSKKITVYRGFFALDPYLKILERIDQLVAPTERGDVLVFLSGMYEITTLAEGLTPYAQLSRYTK